MVYRRQARPTAATKIVLRRRAAWWAVGLVLPMMVTWARVQTLPPVRWGFGVDHGPNCDIDNCGDVGRASPDDLALHRQWTDALGYTMMLALGATLVFAASLMRSRKVVVVIDRAEGVVQLRGWKLDARVRFADAPALVESDGALLLQTRDGAPIVIARFRPAAKTVARLRDTLADLSATG